MPIPINWNQDDGTLKPGYYKASVRHCDLKHSKASGAPMLDVVLYFGDRKLCHDNIMLEGGGWGIGKRKLLALGVEEGTAPELHELIGREVIVAVHEEEYNGKTSLKVNVKALRAGYFPADEIPLDVTVQEPPASDTPF